MTTTENNTEKKPERSSLIEKIIKDKTFGLREKDVDFWTSK